MKICRLPYFCLLFLMAYIAESRADESDPIFSTLAEKAGVVGDGLINSGYIIAGFGLLVFSFMAIFNKISWKTLAYIMFSTFVLSTVALVIKYVGDDKVDTTYLPEPTYDDSDLGGGSNTQANPANKGNS